MCRSIKKLRDQDPRATPADIEAAARQFVRKISGFSKPSKRNEAKFEGAVRDIAAVSQRLLLELESAQFKSAGTNEGSDPGIQSQIPV